MSTFVIGDIHGELEQLKTLIQKINLNDEDELYVLGDVIDRGLSSIEALQYLMTNAELHLHSREPRVNDAFKYEIITG